MQIYKLSLIPIFLLLLPVCVFAQALPLRFTHERMVAKGNAVYLGNSLAITAAHCVEGYDLTTLTVNRTPASLISHNGELALLKVDCPNVRPAQISRNPATKNTKTMQVYFSPDDDKRHLRDVVWQSESRIWGGIVPGMSGSGFYDENGDLVGIAEKLYGETWNVLDIVHFLVENNALNWSLEDHRQLMFNHLGVRGEL